MNVKNAHSPFLKLSSFGSFILHYFARNYYFCLFNLESEVLFHGQWFTGFQFYTITIWYER